MHYQRVKLASSVAAGYRSSRVVIGPDYGKSCRRAGEALDVGYRLDDAPAAMFDGERVIVGQAVVWSQDVSGDPAATSG